MRTSKYSIFWYKMGEDNQPKKLDSSNGKKYLQTEVDPKTFKMNILDLKKNDSGVYYCGLISFSSNQTLIESKKINLTVSEKNHDPGPSEDPGEEERQDEEGHQKILLPVVTGSGLLLVLVGSCVLLAYLMRRKQEHRSSQGENAPLVSLF
nr:programmed cell death protein 1 [Pogona vitticeps]